MKDRNMTRRDAIKKIGVGAVAGAAFSAGNVFNSFGNSEIQSERLTEYSWVRGFNYQPSWGCNGLEIWNDFRKSTFAKEVDLGMKHFPKLNALRIWFSYDAFQADHIKFLKAAKQAAAILGERNIKMIPVIFNNWHSFIDFGGFCDEQLRGSKKRDYAPHRQYLRELVEAIRPANNLLMYDIANEPFNNGGRAKITLDFLESMSRELKGIDPDTPVSIGTQGIFEGGPDLDAIDSFVDVHAIHPYWNKEWCSQEEHEKRFNDMIIHLKKLGKPAIATECCWGSDDDSERVKYIRNDLGLLAKAGIGFFPHAMHHSRVADLHRRVAWREWHTMYMGFIDPDGSIRPGHEVYNEYQPLVLIEQYKVCN